MSELIILPEMLQAGMEALAECKKRKLKSEDVCVAVYLAMQGVLEMRSLRGESERLH